MTPLERGQSAKGKLAHRQKRMTVKASSYIASIEAAAPALAVQAIIKMPFATRSTWLSWLDRLRLAAFLLCCPGELTRLLEGCAVEVVHDVQQVPDEVLRFIKEVMALQLKPGDLRDLDAGIRRTGGLVTVNGGDEFLLEPLFDFSAAYQSRQQRVHVKIAHRVLNIFRCVALLKDFQNLQAQPSHDGIGRTVVEHLFKFVGHVGILSSRASSPIGLTQSEGDYFYAFKAPMQGRPGQSGSSPARHRGSRPAAAAYACGRRR